MNPPRFFAVAVALSLVLGVAACSDKAGVAATVNGTEISDAQVARLEPALRLLVEAQGGSCDSTAPPPAQGAPPPPPGEKGSCDALVLEQLIQAQLVKDFAAEKKLAPSATDVNEFMTQVEGALGGQTQSAADSPATSSSTNQAAVNALLADKGVSTESLRELAQSLVAIGKVATYMSQNVSDATLQQIYDANAAQFATFDTAHVLVATEAEAQKIKDEATTANFADLAKKYSTDKASAVQGGDLGSVTASSFVPEFSNAVLAAKPGQIIGPVKSQFGYHVIWVKKLEIKTFDQVKDQIKTQLGQQGSGLALSAYISDQLNSGGVDVNPRYGRLDTKTGAIVPVSSTAVSPSPEASIPSP